MKKEEYRAAFKRNVGRALTALLVCAAIGAVIIGCKSTGSDDSPPEGFRITKFMIDENEGVINESARTIEIVMPYDTDVEQLEPIVEFVGANIDPAPGTIVDFSEPVKYTVFSKDGSSFVYLAMVTLEIPNTKEILSFALTGVTAISSAVIDLDEDTGIILVTVPYGTDVKNRTTVIVHNGNSVSPVEGKPQNFTQPVTYEIYSFQGEKRTYTVEVTIAENTETRITRFTLSGAEGVVAGTNIVVSVPFGTDLTSLTPYIELSDGATISPTGAQDFSHAVHYTVTAADNTTTMNYTVTATVAANTAKEITAFTIAGQENSVINGTTITVSLPVNMPKTNLAPTIAFTGSTVTPASGVAQNFSSDVKYTVTAADSSTKEYTVTVIYAAGENVTFNSVSADGASWTTETTALTLYFSKDMGDALKAEHITVSGTITKGALTNKGSGTYELAVSGIPGDNVSINVTVAASSVYGFTITGSLTRNTNVFKAPVEVAWQSLTANGTDKTQTTTELTLTFDKDVGLTAADITLGTGAAKGTLSPSGTTRTLTISGITTNAATLMVSLNKTGFAFNPSSLPATVYKKLGTDAGLSSLTVEGYNLTPSFDTNVIDYTLEVVSQTLRITATAIDAGAKLVYVENSSATVTSGMLFNSKKLNEGANTITVKVTAEDGGLIKSYMLKVTFSDFPTGEVAQNTFTVSSTAEWEAAADTIKNGGPDQNYIINVTKDFNVTPVFGVNTFGNVKDITVVIRGDKTIGLSNTGKLLSLYWYQSVILRDITLEGRTDNNQAVVYIAANGEFEMRGDAKITGNTNIQSNGGGVYLDSAGRFTMRENSSVSGNTAYSNNGGVYLSNGSSFTMRENSSVSGNTANGSGGGVYISGGTFTMRDSASVSGNTVNYNEGGGLYVSNGTFRMAGGTVYGSDEPSSLKNTAPNKPASATLCVSYGEAEYGTGGTDGEAWISNGSLNTTEDKTIKVVNGVLQ